MAKNRKARKPVRYKGPSRKSAKWLDVALPTEYRAWVEGGRRAIRNDRSSHRSFAHELRKVREHGPWEWPKRQILFLTDMHADADAFTASLIASGGVEKTGPEDGDFRLTRAGRKALFLIGGDCFDKGPGNLRLLRMIRTLRDHGARLKILVGNHDLRILLGTRSIGAEKDPRTEHFFIRMSPKVVPFLKEVWDEYLKDRMGLHGIPNARTCRRILYPTKGWFKRFPYHAGWVMPDQTVESEVERLKQKMAQFAIDCEEVGLSIRMAYAAAIEWRRQFVHRKGEFAWFFRDVTLTHREGSFLFLHAGLDDRAAQVIHDKGLKVLNRMFRAQLFGDPFEFYYGPLANMVRTKYRPIDMPLTKNGARRIHDMGIHAVVHGHLRLAHGQRIVLRRGIVNFECDSTMDINTRREDGLPGHGAAVTIFEPDGRVIGISRDCSWGKVFELA